MSRRRRNDQPVEWHFFSFPVGFAFVLGMFVAVMLYPLGPILFIVSLFLTSFGAAHIISRFFRRRTLDRQKLRDEENERERRALAARAAAQRSNAVEDATPRPKRRTRRMRRGRRADEA